MAGTTLPAAAPLPGRSLRARLEAAPLAAALLILAALLGGYAAAALAVGGSGALWGDGPLGLHPIFRFNVVLLLILAFTFWTGYRESPAVLGDVASIRGLLACGDAELEALLQGAFGSRASRATSFALGAAVGIGLVLLSAWAAGNLPGWRPDYHDAFNSVFMMLLFGNMALRGHLSARASALFSTLGREYVAVRLLDPSPLRVFAQRGLRQAAYWFIGSGIALLLLIDAGVPGVVLGVIAVTLALGVITLITSTLGVHRRLGEVKRAELERVRRAIEAIRAELLAGSSEGSQRMQALIAYERRVDDVSEWPVDAPVLLRFGLLVLIPLGSWLGGALVERALDSLL